MSVRNNQTQPTHESMVVTNVDTDGNGDVEAYGFDGDTYNREILVEGLRQIEGPEDVSVQAAGGYVANCIGVDGNTITVRIFQSAGAASEMAAVTGTADVTDLHINATGQ